jgi:hypothetical protein
MDMYPTETWRGPERRSGDDRRQLTRRHAEAAQNEANRRASERRDAGRRKGDRAE